MDLLSFGNHANHAAGRSTARIRCGMWLRIRITIKHTVKQKKKKKKLPQEDLSLELRGVCRQKRRARPLGHQPIRFGRFLECAYFRRCSPRMWFSFHLLLPQSSSAVTWHAAPQVWKGVSFHLYLQPLRLFSASGTAFLLSKQGRILRIRSPSSDNHIGMRLNLSRLQTVSSNSCL